MLEAHSYLNGSVLYMSQRRFWNLYYRYTKWRRFILLISYVNGSLLYCINGLLLYLDGVVLYVNTRRFENVCYGYTKWLQNNLLMSYENGSLLYCINRPLLHSDGVIWYIHTRSFGNVYHRYTKWRQSNLLMSYTGLFYIQMGLFCIDRFWNPTFRNNWDVRDVDKLSWDLWITLGPHWGKWAILVQSAHLWISQPDFRNQSIQIVYQNKCSF